MRAVVHIHCSMLSDGDGGRCICVGGPTGSRPEGEFQNRGTGYTLLSVRDQFTTRLMADF